MNPRRNRINIENNSTALGKQAANTPEAIPEVDGNLIRREGGVFLLKETGEELEELCSSGIEELFMSNGGRFFLRGKIEQFFLDGQWEHGDLRKAPEQSTAPRRYIYNDSEISRSEAHEWIFDHQIPGQLWEDFSLKSPIPVSEDERLAIFRALNDLEQCVDQALAAMHLFSITLSERFEEAELKGLGSAVGIGIAHLGNTASRELDQARKNLMEKWLKLASQGKAQAA